MSGVDGAKGNGVGDQSSVSESNFPMKTGKAPRPTAGVKRGDGEKMDRSVLLPRSGFFGSSSVLFRLANGLNKRLRQKVFCVARAKRICAFAHHIAWIKALRGSDLQKSNRGRHYGRQHALKCCATDPRMNAWLRNAECGSFRVCSNSRKPARMFDRKSHQRKNG
jgi:hypothetical protein